MIHTPCIQPIYQYSTSLGNREMKYSVSVLKNFLKKSIEEFRWFFLSIYIVFIYRDIQNRNVLCCICCIVDSTMFL